MVGLVDLDAGDGISGVVFLGWLDELVGEVCLPASFLSDSFVGFVVFER